jgi:hypothetical protein
MDRQEIKNIVKMADEFENATSDEPSFSEEYINDCKQVFVEMFKIYSHGKAPDKRITINEAAKCKGGIGVSGFIVAWRGDGQLMMTVCFIPNEKPSLTRISFGWDKMPKDLISKVIDIVKMSGETQNWENEFYKDPKPGKLWGIGTSDYYHLDPETVYKKLVDPIMSIA